MKRWLALPVILAILVSMAGYYYVDWRKAGSGSGLYSRLWQPEAVFAYWSPQDFYQSVQTVQGSFSGEQCLACHQAVTPGIVKDWQHSRHSQVEPKVYCTACHGTDHQHLHLPTPEVCGSCHPQQHSQFVDEKRFGFPSHALAMERAVDAHHFVDKPKAEVTACLQCHSVATKCDSCHTRHKFSAAEARRPEACITCHSGPPHPDDTTYFHSKHGQLYLAEGDTWDWSKPLSKGNYPAPSCAYCHLAAGKHQVADKAIWQFGTKQINPLTASNMVKRQQWVKVCADCHAADWAQQQLAGLDAERKRAWDKLYQAEDQLKALRSKGLLSPSAKQRPPYPNEGLARYWPRERIGFFEGQASAFYNVSPLEREYFEMWYFANLGAYKGAAHGDSAFMVEQHQRLDMVLHSIQAQADALQLLKPLPLNKPLELIWLQGEYTEYNAGHN